MELSFLLKYCYCSCITIFIVHKMWSQLIYLAFYAYCLQTSYTYVVWICLQACTPQPAPYCQGCRTPSFREDNLSQVRNWPPEWSVYNHLYYVTYMELMHNLILIAYLEILTLRFLCRTLCYVTAQLSDQLSLMNMSVHVYTYLYFCICWTIIAPVQPLSRL